VRAWVFLSVTDSGVDVSVSSGTAIAGQPESRRGVRVLVPWM
jgi:hypothetical protein